MAHVPPDARWFLAQIVEEIRVSGHKRNIVHINFVIINARSPKDAFQKAMKLGKQAEMQYVNSEGNRVAIRFVGLRDLDVIYDDLGHGCEIMFSEKLGVSHNGLRRIVRKKNELEVFLPVRSRLGRPDYSSKEIMDEANKELARKKNTHKFRS